MKNRTAKVTKIKTQEEVYLITPPLEGETEFILRVDAKWLILFAALFFVGLALLVR